MIDPARIEIGLPTSAQVLVTAVLVFMAGAIAGAGLTVLIWSPP